MTARMWDTGFWADPDFEGIGPSARLLYFYLTTSPHANAAGLYRLSARKMAFETELTAAEVDDALDALEARGKIRWSAAESVIWVLGFARRNVSSPKLLRPAVTALRDIGGQWPELWLRANAAHLARWAGDLSAALAEARIPYPRCPDTLSAHPDTLSAHVATASPDTLSRDEDRVSHVRGRAGAVQDRADQNRTGEGETRVSAREPTPTPRTFEPEAEPAGARDDAPGCDPLAAHLQADEDAVNAVIAHYVAEGRATRHPQFSASRGGTKRMVELALQHLGRRGDLPDPVDVLRRIVTFCARSGWSKWRNGEDGYMNTGHVFGHGRTARDAAETLDKLLNLTLAWETAAAEAKPAAPTAPKRRVKPLHDYTPEQLAELLPDGYEGELRHRWTGPDELIWWYDMPPHILAVMTGPEAEAERAKRGVTADPRIRSLEAAA